MALSKFHADKYCKVFLCGDEKRKLASTLSSSSIKTDASCFLRGGIVYHKLKRDIGNNVAFYELPGPPTHYNCHGEVLGDFIAHLPAVFIVVVRLKDGLIQAKNKLFYWGVFIENACHHLIPAQCHVILLVKHSWNTAESEISEIERVAKRCFRMAHIRVLRTKSFEVKKSQNLIANLKMLVTSKYLTNKRCLAIHDHVTTVFADKDAIGLDDLIKSVSNSCDQQLARIDRETIDQDLKALTDCGLIFYIDSWIVLNQHSVSNHVSSFLAKKGSRIASNTGLIFETDLRETQEFLGPYNFEMLVQFMKSFEFCHEISEDVLSLIQNRFQASHDERLLFFPALRFIGKSEMRLKKGFGWRLWCPNYNSVFTTAFNEALFFKLAYTYAQRNAKTNTMLYISRGLSLTISQSEACVSFQTEDQVHVLMEITPRSITLLINDADREPCQRTLSSIIRKVLEMTGENEYSPQPKTEEFVIQPDKIKLFPDKDVSPYMYRIESIARGIMHDRTTVTNDSNSCSLSSLLNLDPFLSLPYQMISDFFKAKNALLLIPNDTVKQIQEKLHPLMRKFMTGKQTYQSLWKSFSQYSVFAHRTPQELAGTFAEEDTTLVPNEGTDANLIVIENEYKKALDSQFQNLGRTPQGIAFVFGAYGPNGVKIDVRNIQETFENVLDFTVYDHNYPTHDQLIALVNVASSYQYTIKLRKFKFIVFYFAGHGGVNSLGEPYILTAESSKQVKIAPDILQPFSKHSKTCLFFFDCCLSSNTSSATADYSAWYALTAPPSCFVAFATNIGFKSSGDAVKGGLWTYHLCEHLKEKNLSLSTVVERTNEDVTDSSGTQFPMFSSAISEVHLHKEYRKRKEDGVGIEQPKKRTKVEVNKDKPDGNVAVKKRNRNNRPDDDIDEVEGQPAAKKMDRMIEP